MLAVVLAVLGIFSITIGLLSQSSGDGTRQNEDDQTRWFALVGLGFLLLVAAACAVA